MLIDVINDVVEDEKNVVFFDVLYEVEIVFIENVVINVVKDKESFVFFDVLGEN